MKPASSKAAGKPSRKVRANVVVPVASPIREAAWCMPSGLGLTEFAWRGGFVAPGLMKRNEPGSGERA
jgi:hypothetical protein